MSETNIIKSITTHNCPHCQKEIFIENQMIPPVAAALFTGEDIKKAKEDCLARIATLVIDDEKKSAVTSWINDPTTVFSGNEVESIILSLLKSE